IAGMGLNNSEQQLDEATGVARSCGIYSENSGVARGMNWITAKFAFDARENLSKSYFYNVYGIERLGRLSGQRFIGKYDWYREGCQFLVAKQQGDGSIKSGSGIDSAEVLSTAFALLFLSKGRTPVLVSKLAWGEFRDLGNGTFAELGERNDPAGAVNWNRKHNDTRHIVEYASKELFKATPLAWQVYDVRRQNLGTQEQILGEVGVLLESPVLYINGHGPLKLT